MNESIHKFFRVGTLQWMSFPDKDPIDSLIQIACDDFFDAVEVKGYSNVSEQAQAAKLLNQSHLTVCYGAQPLELANGLNPNAIDEDERKKAEEALLHTIDEAHFLGAEGISFLAGKWTPEHRNEAFSQLLKTTRTLCDYAKTKGMMVELEIFDYDVDKASLMGPAPYAAQFAAEMRMTHNNFGLLVDLSHIPITHESSEFVVRTLRPYITHFHIGNAVVKEGCDGYGDKHPRFGYPESANDTDELRDFFQVLKNEDFFNAAKPYVLSIEVTPRPGENSDIVLASTKRVIRRAWALVE